MSAAGEAEIRMLIANYGAAFDDADAVAVTGMFAWPATIWQFGDGHVFQDAGELAENVEALIDVFDEAGIAISNPEVTSVRIEGAAAFATATMDAARRGGNPAQPVHLPLSADRRRRRLAHRDGGERGGGRAAGVQIGPRFILRHGRVTLNMHSGTVNELGINAVFMDPGLAADAANRDDNRGAGCFIPRWERRLSGC